MVRRQRWSRADRTVCRRTIGPALPTTDGRSSGTRNARDRSAWWTSGALLGRRRPNLGAKPFSSVRSIRTGPTLAPSSAGMARCCSSRPRTTCGSRPVRRSAAISGVGAPCPWPVREPGGSRALRPRLTLDAAGRGVHVHPDHASVLDELQPVGVAVEFGSEIVGAAHEGHDPALNLGKMHRAAYRPAQGWSAGLRKARPERIYGTGSWRSDGASTHNALNAL